MDLIEREWLDGGHQFSLRHRHVTSAPEKESAPIFLLFLEAVWQVCGREEEGGGGLGEMEGFRMHLKVKEH